MQLDSVGLPGDAMGRLSAQRRPPSNGQEDEKRSTGILSMLAERFREPAATANGQNTIVVLPFVNFGPPNDRAALRLRPRRCHRRPPRPHALPRRPPLKLAYEHPSQQLDPLSIGRKLLVQFVLAGNFLRSEKGFDLNWQLLDVPSQSVRTGGSINVASLDLISVQTEICNEVFSDLQGFGDLHLANDNRGSNRQASLIADRRQAISEEYLQARAVLSSFMSRTGSRDDLNRAASSSSPSSSRTSTSPPAGPALASLICSTPAMASAVRCTCLRHAAPSTRPLRSIQAPPKPIFTASTCSSRAAKKSPPATASNTSCKPPATTGTSTSSPVITLRTDGMYEEALDQFNTSLRLNPSNAAVIYNHRARVYHYQNQLELAADEIEKGLTLEPRQPLLRISLGYQQMRTGDLTAAVETLESAIRDDASLRIIFPTIALCYVQLGDRVKAASFIVDETLSAAEADSEMAYRLATYFAVEGDESEALHWLRRAIYLGNENFPWFSINPSWKRLSGHSDFERILEDLKKSYRRNQKNWKRLLSQVRS